MQEVFDRIRIAVHKHRVRTPEFFKDYDPLRSGVITEQQFICGLSLAIGSEAQLSRGDMQKVVEFYKRSDARVGYKEFVDMLENGNCLLITFSFLNSDFSIIKFYSSFQ